MSYGQEEIHAGEEIHAAAVDTVVSGIAVVHIDTGSRCVLVESDQAAAADTVSLAGFAVVADVNALGIVDLVDAAAQSSLVVVADIAG